MAGGHAKVPLFIRWFQGANRSLKAALIAVSLVLIIGGFVIYQGATSGCPTLRGTVVFAGTNDRLTEMAKLGSCDAPLDGSVMFGSDLAIIIGYWLLGTIVIANGWWRYEAIALRRLLPFVVWLPAIVAICDIIEDGLLLYSLDNGTAPPTYRSDLLAIAVFFFSWTKWSLVVVTLVVGVMSLTIWGSRRTERYREDHPNFALTPQDIEDRNLQALDRPVPKEDPEFQRLDAATTSAAGPSETVGICFSGGGIRSAAFSLGVLSAIEGDGGPEAITGSARYISAVSGGSWAATAWTIERARAEGPAPVADEIFKSLTKPGGRNGFQPQKFLVNGRLSINGLVAWAILCSAVNIALVALLVFLVAWPLGFLMGTEAMRPDLPADTEIKAPPDGSTLAGIAITITAVGAAGIVACGFFRKRIATKWTAGAAVVGLGAFTAAYLVGLPALFVLVADEPVETVTPAGAAAVTAIGTSLFASVWAAVWRVISGPVTKEVTGIVMRLLPRLFGVLILLGWLTWACVVMYYGARRYGLSGIDIFGWHPSVGWVAMLIWLVAFALVAVMYVFLNPNWPTLHNIYAQRLTTTFDSTSSAPRWPGSKPMVGMTWRTLAGLSKPNVDPRVPELILCCAQQRVGISSGGLRAESFTISPHWVRQGKRSLPHRDYADATAAIAKTGPGFSNTFRDLECVAPWLATTGAAFSSAMGRQSLGSANALLATVNADLGAWLPNVIEVQSVWASRRVPGAEVQTADELDQQWQDRLPKPRFAYILKEILGWYSPNDRYVFITDGGHWENLGLVELLRRKCDVIYCVDASGDPPSKFTTLREAFSLESLELDRFASDLDLDAALGEMLPKLNALPTAIATSFTVKRRDGTDVKIHYTKLQSTQRMPAHLRRFAVADPAFPHYSTAKQFLTAKQFEKLYQLGQFAGQNLIASAETLSTPAPKSDPPTQGTPNSGTSTPSLPSRVAAVLHSWAARLDRAAGN
jgi:hypothetical protein